MSEQEICLILLHPDARFVTRLPVQRDAHQNLLAGRQIVGKQNSHFRYAGEIWNRRVSTPDLNRWLAAVQERHPPPLVASRRLRLRYIAQVNTRPPTFALFASKPGELPDSYRRYLVNALRQDFDLPGTPIRMMLRKGKNPYQPR